MAATVGFNSLHRKHYKAGCWSDRGINYTPNFRFGMTRSARQLLRQAEFEDDQTAAAEARRKETERRAEMREARRQERNSPLPKAGFLRRAVNFLKGMVA